MDRLKGRCVRIFKKNYPGAILASGTRKNESKRRFGGTKPFSFWEGVPIIAPVYDWPTDAVWKFFYDRGFTRAPAYSTVGISGDCLCGSFVDDPDERRAVDVHYPAIGAELDDISRELKRRGTCPAIRCEWGWGYKRPKKGKSVAENAICFECGDAADEVLP